jgi:uncharacterized protein YjdB
MSPVVDVRSFLALLLIVGCASPSGVASSEDIAVVVTPAAVSVPDGGSTILVATVRGAPGATVRWASSHASVAIVDGNGVVTGNSQGSATVVASAMGKIGWAQVTVTPPLIAYVAVSPRSVTLEVGGVAHLSATPKDYRGRILEGRGVSWRSTNTGVATVDADGIVRGQAPGRAVIVASSGPGTGGAAVLVEAAEARLR